MECNLDFLCSTLTVGFVNDGVTKAVARLKGEPEWERARRLEDDLPGCQELLTLRVAELPLLLSQPSSIEGWTMRTRTCERPNLQPPDRGRSRSPSSASSS